MQQEILELLTVQNFEDAAALAQKLEPQTLADFLNELNDNHPDLLLPLCRALDSNALAECLVLLDSEVQEQIIGGLRDYELDAVMEEVSVEETVDIIEEMPSELVRRIAETEEIMLLLRERNYTVLKPLLSSMNAIDLAKVVEETENSD